jgi:hypothetical protein
MDILSANQDTTARFIVTIQETNAKYKKEKEDLKRIIVETVRSQAEQILADNDDSSMGNPKKLYKQIGKLNLQYNSIIVKQKQEIDSIMNEYSSEIFITIREKLDNK